ncbi:MAG: hypothetical protein U0I25_06485, partial [Oscillospiraceae bacterium]|nr:hypothetical protein [Oscillospiraceae bacterium]
PLHLDHQAQNERRQKYAAAESAQLLIDKETYEAEYFSCHPCLCTSTIKLKTSDVKNMLLPKVHHEPIVVEL